MNNLYAVMSLTKSQSSVDEQGQKHITECVAQALVELEFASTHPASLKKRKLEAFIALDYSDRMTKLYIIGEKERYKTAIGIDRNDSRFSWLLENALVKARVKGYNIWRAETYR